MQTHLPIGYKMVDGKIQIEQEKSAAVKKIYSEYVNGKSILAISKELKENNVPNANNKTNWTHGAVGKILQNTKYMGDDLYPPLISKELFHQAQEKRQQKTAQCACPCRRAAHLCHYPARGMAKSRRGIGQTFTRIAMFGAFTPIIWRYAPSAIDSRRPVA